MFLISKKRIEIITRLTPQIMELADMFVSALYSIERIYNCLRYIFVCRHLTPKVFYEEGIVQYCDRCGRWESLNWMVSDEIYVEVRGNEGGTPCLTCFLGEAERKGIEVKDCDILVEGFLGVSDRYTTRLKED